MIEQITASGISTAIIGCIYGIIKFIQWWIKDKKTGPSVVIENNPTTPPAPSPQAPTSYFTHQQEEELHAIYLYTTEQKIQSEYLRADIRAIKEGQDNMNSKISEQILELVSSTQRLVDRISDLITTLRDQRNN